MKNVKTAPVGFLKSRFWDKDLVSGNLFESGSPEAKESGKKRDKYALLCFEFYKTQSDLHLGIFFVISLFKPA